MSSDFIFALLSALLTCVGLSFLFAADSYRRLQNFLAWDPRKLNGENLFISYKVLHPEDDERNGQQTSDLILEGGFCAPHPQHFPMGLMFPRKYLCPHH